MPKQRFFFCPKCGGSLAYRRRSGRERLTCGACGYVFYENPVVGVAAIVQRGGEVLLGRRGPSVLYTGRWCIPCGYVEYDEDVHQAAVRECREETGLEVDLTGVYAVLSNFHNPEQHTVGIWFTTAVKGGVLRAGDDLDQVAFFPLHGPLPPLAFPTDRTVLDRLRRDWEESRARRGQQR